MSVENKIREFLKGGETISEAYPGMGKNKESVPPMQGGSEKPQVQTLDKGAGADAAKKAGSVTTLAAGSGPMDKTAPSQGSSNANPEKEDLGQDAPGKEASAKAKKTSLPNHKGAGQAHGTTPSVDPATVVAQKTSKGNVHQEEAELEVEEDFITEEEYEALSDEEKAEYEMVELSEEEADEVISEEEFEALSDEEKEQYELVSDEELEEDFITEEEFESLSDEEKAEYEVVQLDELKLKTMAKAYRERTKRELSADHAEYNKGRGPNDETKYRDRDNETPRQSFPKSTRTAEYIKAKHGDKGKKKLEKSDTKMRVAHMGRYKHADVARNKQEYGKVREEFEANTYDFSADIASLFSGDETLSEEFKTKAASIFEAVVLARVADIRSEIEENASIAAAEVIEEQVDEITNKVDAYMNYVVEQWMEENKVAVESGLRSEMTEQFINGLRNLFAENFIEVPEERYDVLGEMQEAIEQLEAALNEKLEESATLSAELSQLKRSAVLDNVTEGLAQTEIEKFKSLVEEISFEDESSFAEKLKVVKENYFPKTKTVSTLTESDESSVSAIETETSSAVLKYAAAIASNVKFTK